MPASRVVRLPNGIGFDVAASLGVPGPPAVGTVPCRWTGPYWWTPRSRVRINTRDEHHPGSQGDGSNYTNPRIEPPDHGVGRSRGGLSTMIHQLVDGTGLALANVVTQGQAGDSPMFLLIAGDPKNRNVVERQCCHLKQRRGLATHYDKHAVIYRAAVVLNAVTAWTCNYQTCPKCTPNSLGYQ